MIVNLFLCVALWVMSRNLFKLVECWKDQNNGKFWICYSLFGIVILTLCLLVVGHIPLDNLDKLLK
jgi:hypothetical protein